MQSTTELEFVVVEDEAPISPLAWLTDLKAPEAIDSFRQFIKASLYEALDEAKRGHPQAMADLNAQAIVTYDQIGKVAEQAIVTEAAEAQEQGWHHFTTNEYDSVGEMLRDLLGEDRSLSLLYDIERISTVVIPFAKKHNLPGVNNLVGKKGNLSSKARAILPRINAALEESSSEEEAAAAVGACLDLIGQPGVTEASIRRDNPNSDQRIPNFTVYEYLLNEEASTVVIRTADRRQRAWIVSALTQKANWALADRWAKAPSTVGLSADDEELSLKGKEE
jgi:hypothetical protein